MGKIKTANQIRNFPTAHSYMRQNDCPELRQNGSHVVYGLPNGERLVLTNHGSKDYGTGLRQKIIKTLLAAGLPCALFYYFFVRPEVVALLAGG